MCILAATTHELSRRDCVADSCAACAHAALSTCSCCYTITDTSMLVPTTLLPRGSLVAACRPLATRARCHATEWVAPHHVALGCPPLLPLARGNRPGSRRHLGVLFVRVDFARRRHRPGEHRRCWQVGRDAQEEALLLPSMGAHGGGDDVRWGGVGVAAGLVKALELASQVVHLCLVVEHRWCCVY